MNEYLCSIDGGEGGTTTVQASDLDEACGLAAIWARSGEWREDGEVSVSVEGPDGEETFGQRVTTGDTFGR